MVDDAHLIDIAQAYLRDTAEREFDASQRYLDREAEFIYPNGTFGDLRDVFAAGDRRYRRIRKHHDTWDIVEKPEGTVVVVSAGTLSGENIAGVPFEGIRYVDRITFRHGRIIRQEVWNDLAESGVLTRLTGDENVASTGVQQEQEKA